MLDEKSGYIKHNLGTYYYLIIYLFAKMKFPSKINILKKLKALQKDEKVQCDLKFIVFYFSSWLDSDHTAIAMFQQLMLFLLVCSQIWLIILRL